MKEMKESSEHLAYLCANDLFVKLMTLAAEAGKEHPPMVGVDTRPGTKNPRFIPLYRPPDVGSRSVAGSVADVAL